MRNGDVPAADKTYLAQLVSARTGINQADAEKRVNEVIAKAKVPAGQPGRNRAISAALAEKIRSLFAGTPKSHPASPAQP